MSHFCRYHFVLSIILFLLISWGNISQSAEPNADGTVTVPLIGFRQLNPDLIINADDQDHKTGNTKVSGIPLEAFLSGVKTSADVRKALRDAGVNEDTAGTEDWFLAAQQAASTSAWNTASKGSPEKMQVDVFSPITGENNKLDGSIFVGLAGSELFKMPKNQKLPIATMEYKGTSFDILRSDAQTTQLLRDSYLKIPSGPKGDSSKWTSEEVHNWAKGVALVAGGLSSRPATYRAIILNEGAISFGQPQIYTPAQRVIDVPKPAGKPSKLFSIDFSFTIRDLELKKIKHLTFCAEITPSTVVSLQLKPDLRNPGDQYQKLKPKIIPGGLGENQLIWTMSDHALEHGFYNFTCVMLVPEALKSINVSQSIVGRTQKTFWVREETIATPEIVVERIELKSKP
ncbi:hypothetical protein Pan241w_35070 [Gimesia alba]|uniref:Uncharacterized protein n=1 Tax=Gimesia alba TaxID=2527973 RepID=A0A517RHQ6_9PLAN|nr:hypothetical protein [Gimesia alba]QDT43407.1 hypothetical protein Pan241w_35070 [Gimesia alba]